MEKFTSKQERLMEKARDLKNKVLKKVTALQIFKGTKKSGKQIIKDSDKVVIFKMENGQEFITNGYFMIKKGYDKAMDEMLVKFADKVEVMEQKMKTFYTGYESDYAMVTNADVRVFNTLLTTEKTTMITKNDSMDTYHAYMNSYYYRYFEKKVSKMGISSTVQPVVMFDDKNEFVGCILPVRMTLEGKKEFENTLTLEEFNEGEKLIKEHRETLLVEIIEGNTDECLEQAVADTERRKKEFDGFIASELKVIKNIDGYYEVGYELEGINELYTHISVYGTRDYGHYDYFLNKPDTKRLAERMLEKIQKELEKNIIEKVENEMNKKQLKEEEQMKKSMDSITDTVEEFGWTVMNILVNIKEENCVGAVIENKYGKLKLEGLYAGADKGDESIELAKKLANYYEVQVIDANGVDINDLEEEKIKQLAGLETPELTVEVVEEQEEEKEVEIKTMDDVDTTLPIGTTVGFRYDEYENDMLVEKKILTGKIVYIFGDYAGKYNVKTNDGNIHLVHNSDIVTWEEPVEKEEKILEQLSELASPEEILATADELGLPSLDEEVSPEPTAEDVAEWQGLENKKEKEDNVNEKYRVEVVDLDTFQVVKELYAENNRMLEKLQTALYEKIDMDNHFIRVVIQKPEGFYQKCKYCNGENFILEGAKGFKCEHCLETQPVKKEKEEEVKEVKDIKIINKTDNEVLEKLLKEVIEKTKEFEFNEEITICDYDLDRVYLDNKKSDDLTIRMWNITQFTKENKEVVLSIEWTLFENIDNHGEEVSCGFTRIEMPPEQEKEIGCKLDMYIELYNSYNEEIEELDMELAIDGLSEQRVRCLKSIRKTLEDRINNAQSKITSLGEVYVVKYTQRTMSIPSQVRVFKKLEDAEKFADTNENTLEVEGIYIAKNGKLIELDEEKLTPEIKEITKRLDDIAKDIEKNDGYYDYNLENGCTLRLFTDESNPIGITLEIFDSSGMFYMRKVGDENIHEYIDKVEKAQDVLVYEKYGLDDYIDSETGNVVIDVKDIKNKGNIFGTPLEEVIDKLLKENKEFEMKLFNENYIKEPHYMIFRKGEIKNE